MTRRDDIIDGDDGKDVIDGSGGDDQIAGGNGSDRLKGGTGADTFVFRANESGSDIILDWRSEQSDLIDLRDLTAVFGAIDFLGAGNFSGAGVAEMKYGWTSKGTVISIDTDGNGIGDIKITLKVAAALDTDHFLF